MSLCPQLEWLVYAVCCEEWLKQAGLCGVYSFLYIEGVTETKDARRAGAAPIAPGHAAIKTTELLASAAAVHCALLRFYGIDAMLRLRAFATLLFACVCDGAGGELRIMLIMLYPLFWG